MVTKFEFDDETMTTMTTTSTGLNPFVPICCDVFYGHQWTFDCVDGVRQFHCRRCGGDLRVAHYQGLTIYG
jgi:hypothetical protein